VIRINIRNPQIVTRLDEALDRGILAWQLILLKNIRKRLSQKGTGVGYRGGTKRKGMARRRSRPGEPPAVDSNRLRASWSLTAEPWRKRRKSGIEQVQNDRGTPGPRRAFVLGSRVKYAPYLEYGTTRMAPRPYLRPSVADAQTVMLEAIAKTMRRVLQ